jgi:hypothetical protein
MPKISLKEYVHSSLGMGHPMAFPNDVYLSSKFPPMIVTPFSYICFTAVWNEKGGCIEYSVGGYTYGYRMFVRFW